MFIGEYIHNIDNKGRLNLPVKFRKDVRDGVVITRGLDSCLFVYTRDEWEKLAEKLSKLPLSHKKSRAFARLMLAGAWDADIDSQGRIMLPEYLRKYASLDKHVTIAGLYSRIELWNEDTWNEYKIQTEQDSDDIAEAMVDLGV